MCLKLVINISDDAIFIADSHYNKNRPQLKNFLLQIKFNKINTSQLFLMGDMFDFLDSKITYFQKQNKDMIDLLNELSKELEIIYLEGNHDFNLNILFPNIKVFTRKQQPLECNYKDKKILIAHGDIFAQFNYEIYTSIIRNKIFLSFLNIIDINNWLSIKIDNWLLEKKICNKCRNKEEFIRSRILVYENDSNMIIEGHFHYAIINKNYINLPSLSCSNEYFSIKENNFLKI